MVFLIIYILVYINNANKIVSSLDHLKLLFIRKYDITYLVHFFLWSCQRWCLSHDRQSKLSHSFNNCHTHLGVTFSWSCFWMSLEYNHLLKASWSTYLHVIAISFGALPLYLLMPYISVFLRMLLTNSASSELLFYAINTINFIS